MAKAKKSFYNKNNNPALAYISHIPDTEDGENMQEMPNTEYTLITDNTQNTKPIKETKSRRVNFIITPSLHKELTIISHMQRISLNELVNQVMGEYATTKREQIDKYLTLVGED